MEPSSLIITDHAQFYKVALDDERTVYMPAGGENAKNNARASDIAGDPPVVGGFAVYDTNVSTEYAIAIYGEKKDAQAHKPSVPAPAPETVFEDTTKSSDADATDTEEPTSKPKSRTAKSGWNRGKKKAGK